MPAYRNTDNGRVIQVAESEAFIYEKASNFELVVQAPAAKPAPKSAPKKATPKKKV